MPLFLTPPPRITHFIPSLMAMARIDRCSLAASVERELKKSGFILLTLEHTLGIFETKRIAVLLEINLLCYESGPLSCPVLQQSLVSLRELVCGLGNHTVVLAG